MKKTRAGHIIIKLLKISSKEKMFKNIEKKICYVQRNKDIDYRKSEII